MEKNILKRFQREAFHLIPSEKISNWNKMFVFSSSVFWSKIEYFGAFHQGLLVCSVLDFLERTKWFFNLHIYSRKVFGEKYFHAITFQVRHFNSAVKIIIFHIVSIVFVFHFMSDRTTQQAILLKSYGLENVNLMRAQFTIS